MFRLSLGGIGMVDSPDQPADVLSMDVEISFIPPQRSIEVVNELQDTIGVVGQGKTVTEAKAPQV